MYQSLLTRRYLTSKVMPLLAAICVGLCCAMVFIAWSIMGGFLSMLLEVGRKMEGDVSIVWPTVGFAHYEDLIKRLEQDPLVAGAAPMIDAFGMLNLPDNRVIGVSIKGIDERFAKVSDYANQLWWKPIDHPVQRDKAGDDPRLDPRDKDLWQGLYEHGLRLEKPDPKSGEMKPAAVLGIEVSGFSIRRPEGFYWPARNVGKRTDVGGMEWIPGFIVGHSVTLNLLPMDKKGRTNNLNSVSLRLPVANEFRTGLFEADKNTVLVRLSELQRALRMDDAERVDAPTTDPYAIHGEGVGEKAPARAAVGVDPARVTTVLVRGKDGVASEELRQRAIEIYREFAAAHAGEVPDVERLAESNAISTWERKQSTFIGAVKKETSIVVGMLLFISLVCAVLILAIFWAMISEKTKDIGILRAVGASSGGVAWLWLRYGLVIGVTGASLGMAIGCIVVWNINPIHEWLGQRFGLTLWDPSVYYFPEIPHRVEPDKVFWVVVSIVFFSLLGSIIPALRAAMMNPVRALRFE